MCRLACRCGAGGGSAPGGPSTSLQSEQPGQALPRELHQQLMALRAEVQQRALAQYDANRYAAKRKHREHQYGSVR